MLVRSRFSLLAQVLLLHCAATVRAHAGGSGLNTVVIVNQNSTNSIELGNYYCERRQVPPGNLLRIYWPGTNTVWTSSDFQTNLLQPLLTMLAARQLTNQVDYVVLSMDIPFQTINGSTIDSTTTALFYGLKPDTNGVQSVVNSYAYSEAIFRLAQPATAPGYSFLCTMLTAGSLDQAKQLVDQGVSSDATFPSQPVVLEKTSDPQRNGRYSEFDNASFNVGIVGRSWVVRTNSDGPPAPLPVLGYQTGLANFSLAPNTFAPGAMADSLTSFGGIIFGPNSQTSLLAFIAAGAAGSYGTVSEPYSDPTKFPNPQDYFYQARGFSLAECYYQSVSAPFLGLVVGEPLAAPFAQLATGKWIGTSSNALLNGTAQLSVSFAGRKTNPLEQIDLFVDGKFSQTLTNLGPGPGNLLNVTIEGYPLTYPVPTNATLSMLATGLVALINSPSVTNVTRTKALAFGDRIELHSLSTNYQRDPFYFLDSAATNGAALFYRASYLPFSPFPQLTPPSPDRSGGLRMHLETAPGVPFVILASTDLANWQPIFTNLLGGEMDFVDSAAAGFPRRFYRVAAPDPRPKLGLASNAGPGFTLHVQPPTALPYALLVSSNLADWTVISNNLAGGPMDLVDSSNASQRFYRALNLPPVLPPATVAAQSAAPAAGNLVSVAGAVRAYTLDVSTNLNQWTPVATNLDIAGGQVSAGSTLGSADTLSTFLSASQPVFLDSPAFGLWKCYVDGTMHVGSWLQLLVTKTNGLAITLTVTNQATNGTLASVGQQLFDAVNSAPALQAADGLAAEDFATDPFGSPSFHLRALSPGYNTATMTVLLSGSSDLLLSPSSTVPLTQNLSDLQPRNHLYLTAGAPVLPANFSLDTTTLADGFHELAAVAYEGSHVHTQTRAVLPIRVQNTALSATLTHPDLPPSAPVQGTYHIQVAANTNNVSFISLFSTGGLLGVVTHQSTATFVIDGSVLGAGLHPFYALVQTSSGPQYRTENQWVRLVDGP
ncbi:MAG TPA: TIGR03790 family protein [Candidatus Binatia bacterium]|jgi:uncharacterized protein (TIGR03790 family)|nr:TIGR03790 family protein [Candidatus Binatia bacterium]